MTAKKKDLTVVSKTGVEIETCYCRKCRQDKKPSEFYVATDLFLDTSGFMSVCKSCLNDIYHGINENEKVLERTILRMCRMLNVKYDEAAISATMSHLETLEKKGIVSEGIFGIYKTKLISVQKTRISERTNDILDLTFEEPSAKVLESLPEQEIPDEDYYVDAWGGKGILTIDDYEFLEKEFIKWKRTTKCDDQNEEVLVREICHKQNDIRKARNEGKSVDALVKSLQEIMKNSLLTPALQNAASSGKSADCFGVWIKDIEDFTPAEWFKNQKKYRDMDGFAEDKKDIIRSTKNFITESRDFNTSDLESPDDLMEEDSIL